MTKIELGGLVALIAAVVTAAIYLDRRLTETMEKYAPVPSHAIVAWTDTSGQIPPGWVLCGQDNTVDLDGRFLMGTNDWGDIGKPVGTETHTHSVALTSGWEHEGTKDGPEGADNYTGGPNWNHKHQVQGKTQEAGHLPPAIQVSFLCKK